MTSSACSAFVSSEAASDLDGNRVVALSDFQREMIELFVHASQVLGVPKSIGEIYGLLFASAEPLTLDQVVEMLQISKGSASQGLRLLYNLNAAKKVYVPGDRRDHYVAELRLRHLVSGFLRERVQPHLESGLERVQHLATYTKGSKEEMDEAKFVADRLNRLRSWHKRAEQLVPLAQKILSVG
jgi:DNA-binding transcriptional regulator GbsR (MarR family)